MVAEGPDVWRVVVNGEEQFAVFPDRLTIPAGWSDAGFAGSQAECAQYVDAHWIDLRPKSLREATVG